MAFAVTSPWARDARLTAWTAAVGQTVQEGEELGQAVLRVAKPRAPPASQPQPAVQPAEADGSSTGTAAAAAATAPAAEWETETHSITAPITGKLLKVNVKAGDIVLARSSTAHLMAEIECPHALCLPSGMCAVCGTLPVEPTATASDAGPSNVGGAVKRPRSTVMATRGFAVSVTADIAQSMQETNRARLLAAKKLVLVLDLDHTLLHTTKDPRAALIQRSDIHTYILSEGRHPSRYFTKLRPGVRQFLERMSSMFEMSVDTKGSRAYASAIVKILDPDGSMFRDRIVSRCDAVTERNKNLGWAHLAADSAFTLVLDDTLDVWAGAHNVLHCAPYKFFKEMSEVNNAAGSEGVSTVTTTDSKAGEEDDTANLRWPEESDEYLVHVGNILTLVYDGFFAMRARYPDITAGDLLTQRRVKSLAGVKLVLTGVIPSHLRLETQPIYKHCVAFGADFVDNVADATHIIANRGATEKVIAATRLQKCVVTLAWLQSSLRFWQLADETKFPLVGFPQFATRVDLPSRSADFEFAAPALSDAQRKALKEDDDFLADLEANPDADEDGTDGIGKGAKIESRSSSRSSNSDSDSEDDLAALAAAMQKRQKTDGED